MRLNIELKDGEFQFDYELGENTRGSCKMPISLRSLSLFTSLCDHALNTRNKYYEDKYREIGLRALAETDPELVEEWLKKNKKKV